MLFFTLSITLILSFFSTAIMSYISMATPIGPWIETTIVLAGMILYGAFRSWYTPQGRMHALGLTAAASGIGGILATACGFSFPTFYFLDKAAFCQLLATPWYFAFLLSMLALAAGSAGLSIAHVFEHALIDRQELPFPIGELVYKMIAVADSVRKAMLLAIGFVGTIVFLGFQSCIALLQKPIQLMSAHTISLVTLPRLSLALDQLPMFWAIGFVTGHVIAIPLLAGLLAKILCIEPLYRLYPDIYQYVYNAGVGAVTGLPFLARELSLADFTIAFCSGMILYGTAIGFLGLPSFIHGAVKKLISGRGQQGEPENSAFETATWVICALVLGLNGAVLTWLGFSIISQLYLLLFTFICCYQLMLIAGKFGIAPLGRFATFVLVPGMFLFGYSALQITVVSTYVEIAGGVACDTLFGRKMARLASIDRHAISTYQWFGLLVSSLTVGAIFWLFISHFGIGLEPGALVAARAASRALLVSIKTFDIGALILGAIFGYLLSFTKINTALLLGGILSPPEYTFMLVLGGMSTYLVKDKEEWYPFWSGVFAANSLWMLARAFFRP